MAKQEDRYENEGIDADLSNMGSVLHGGSSVQQGMRGYSRRTEERGRNEFHGNGVSAELDTGRIHEGGRHYGRPAVDEPAPDGGPPGRPDLGEMGALPPSAMQDRHGVAPFTHDRAEVESKPRVNADRPGHDTPSQVEEPGSTAGDAASPTAKASRKTTAKAVAAKKTTAQAVAVKKATTKAGGAKKAGTKAGGAKKATTKAGGAKKVTTKAGGAKKAAVKKAVR